MSKPNLIKVRIKQNTLLSKLASVFMKSGKETPVATAIGRTIHIKNITPIEFVKRERFLRHELQHIIQKQNIRFFLLKYILQTIKNGYKGNIYELEADRVSSSKFPYNYMVYTDSLIAIRNNEFYALFGKYDPTIDEINNKLSLKFKEYPEIVLK